MDPTKHLPSHPNEEVLEEYVFHRLPEALTAQVEEHLLICESCQETIQKIDEFVSTMKASAVEPSPAWSNLGSSAPYIQHQSWARGRTGVASILALTLLVLVVATRNHPEERFEPATVTLSSVRGTEALAIAPAGRRLELRIEAPDLTPARQYGVELVDATGKQVWKGTGTYNDKRLLAQISRPLGTGVYWIRLSDAAGTALREFGMSVK